MAWVLRSCGYGASITQDNREEKYSRGICYNIFVSSSNARKQDLFRLKRKYDLALKASFFADMKKYDRVSLVDVVDLQYKAEMVCISVDSEDGLYLTNDFIVTHNTTVAVGVAKLLVGYGLYDSLTYIVSPCAEEELGFLPGDVAQKVSVYGTPLHQALIECNEQPERAIMQSDECGMDEGAWVNFIPHTHLRGANLKNKVVIIEEAQNYSFHHLKKTLTRCHDSAKVIVIGHSGQRDAFKEHESAFSRYIRHFDGDDRVAICELTRNYRGWISTHADELF